MFLTAQLVITIFLLAAEKHKGTFLAPIGIGLSLFIAELSGVYFTGGRSYAVNQHRRSPKLNSQTQVLSILHGPSVHVLFSLASRAIIGFTGLVHSWDHCLQFCFTV
jgi:hypothetical protein